MVMTRKDDVGSDDGDRKNNVEVDRGLEVDKKEARDRVGVTPYKYASFSNFDILVRTFSITQMVMLSCRHIKQPWQNDGMETKC
ncbi:hypothetical protein L2E82_30299 [Cichorium intybus]|uniref:Uncharacterized protein n=1 Tax=Cichorium intybus TaxID=13427 RepID=A0ACB9D0P0_CICIN|nr:hypothetical protein L2E82_30299 [Cichorium intybus]